MLANVESLRKIIELEQKKSYLDSAVIGGLDKFLRQWTVKAQQTATNPQQLILLKQLRLADPRYSAMTKPQRKEWLNKVLAFLTESERPEDKPKTTPPANKPPSRTRRKTAPITQPVDSPITVLRGISTAMAAKFSRLGVKTIRDLLYFFPHRHIDYTQRKTISELHEGEEQTIIANIWQASEKMLGGRMGTEAIIGDETGNVRVVWFNQPYLAKSLHTNAQIVISGKPSLFNGRHVFESPEWELIESTDELIHTGRLVPVYSLTHGLYPRQVRKLVKTAVDQWAWQAEDFLPADLRDRCNLLPLPRAINQAHYPENEEAKNKARVRLAFDELFLLQLGVVSRKRAWQAKESGNPFTIQTEVINNFIASLPFALTPAQQKVLKEVLDDLARPTPMSRLLQGDVGSGKTVIATIALLVAAANGYQGAFMAPTEILAEQHFNTICSLLEKMCRKEEESDYLRCYSGLLPEPLTIALLIGEVTLAKKRELHRRIAEGKIDIAIGTHALIQKGIEFQRLGLAVVDEQHRFGVIQRSALREKGKRPHVLVMTATPIPRTLALTLYGDLDLSVIDQLPPGRQVIRTKWLKPEQRDSAYAFIRRQIASGRQAFIICPLIEESEAIQAKAAIAEYETLSQKVFSDLKLGLLHGRMSAVDKDEVMRFFRAGGLDILVSTPVIEVGIDVPNATVMLIEGADRFGLSQLHQFRGRVGRGQEQSYCMLLAQNPSDIGRLRLDLIEKIQDGFQLAEEDLKIRGPGEFFGTRQSGLPDLRMAKLSDVALLELARKEATRLFEIDNELKRPEHRLLAREMTRAWKPGGEWS